MVTKLSETKPSRRAAVTIGTFDGLHRGHKALLEKTLELARAQNLASVVFAFSQPPQNYLGSPKPLILPLEKKLEQLSQKFDHVVSVDFSEVSWMEAEPFVQEILVKKLRTTVIVIGEDWRFGKERKGDLLLLKTLGDRFDFRVEIVPPVVHEGCVISSTVIRELIQSGQVGQAKELLGYVPRLFGKVIKGDGRGRLLGYPTANLSIAPELVQPAEGVYAVRAHYRNETKDAILYIGKRPTFQGKSQTIEVHLFETSEDLYGVEMEVELVHHIRGDRHFPDAESLQRQIQSDVQAARAFLAQHLNC
ncbi:riboflavin biosynthesis protein RibF [Candidatus Acetothermia bacterium]|nr:riboflavin biosynthesis protein RibF [Candidatus Acetothermia bacterium]